LVSDNLGGLIASSFEVTEKTLEFSPPNAFSLFFTTHQLSFMEAAIIGHGGCLGRPHIAKNSAQGEKVP